MLCREEMVNKLPPWRDISTFVSFVFLSNLDGKLYPIDSDFRRRKLHLRIQKVLSRRLLSPVDANLIRGYSAFGFSGVQVFVR
jgi:hypothetical protein